MQFCEMGNTCHGCPAAGLGRELGSEVATTVTATINEHNPELFNSGTLVDQIAAVKGSSRFSQEVLDDGAPFMTAVSAVRRILRGNCSIQTVIIEETGEI